MNQNYIDHADICPTPSAKILPIRPTRSTPQHFWDFFYPPARQISEKSYHPAKVNGACTSYEDLIKSLLINDFYNYYSKWYKINLKHILQLSTIYYHNPQISDFRWTSDPLSVRPSLKLERREYMFFYA